jgi:hypothetical protein
MIDERNINKVNTIKLKTPAVTGKKIIRQEEK